MLTFAHTYVLNRAYQKIHRRNIPLSKGELILGNVIPDFITHLGRRKFQAIAHNLSFLTSLDRITDLEWGAIFHVLCDNYSTLGRITFEGIYHDYPKAGFAEKLSQDVVIDIPLQIPKRRILQCAFDILVIREKKKLLIQMLKAAESFLKANFSKVTDRVAKVFNIAPDQMKVGFDRFLQIYGKDFIMQSASEEYRLFALARNLLKLDSLTDPHTILEAVRNHPELMLIVESNMKLVEIIWHDLLNDLVREVMKYPGLKEALK